MKCCFQELGQGFDSEERCVAHLAVRPLLPDAGLANALVASPASGYSGAARARSNSVSGRAPAWKRHACPCGSGWRQSACLPTVRISVRANWSANWDVFRSRRGGCAFACGQRGPWRGFWRTGGTRSLSCAGRGVRNPLDTTAMTRGRMSDSARAETATTFRTVCQTAREMGPARAELAFSRLSAPPKRGRDGPRPGMQSAGGRAGTAGACVSHPRRAGRCFGTARGMQAHQQIDAVGMRHPFLLDHGCRHPSLCAAVIQDMKQGPVHA